MLWKHVLAVLNVYPSNYCSYVSKALTTYDKATFDRGRVILQNVLLQPLRWRCVECAIHHERDVRED